MRNVRFLVFACLLGTTTYAKAVCTEIGTIEKLSPREGGWVHVQLEGRSNMDLMNCGRGDALGLILNLNDTGGSLEGKKLLYSTILAAFTSGKQLRLCSSACDSQFSSYSKLDSIDDLQ